MILRCVGKEKLLVESLTWQQNYHIWRVWWGIWILLYFFTAVRCLIFASGHAECWALRPRSNAAPAGFLEHLHYMVALHFDKGFYASFWWFFSLLEGIKTVKYLQWCTLGRDNRKFNYAFQFTNVAGPVVFLKGVQGVPWHGFYLPAYFLVELGDKMIDQQWDVVSTLPKWRHHDRELTMIWIILIITALTVIDDPPYVIVMLNLMDSATKFPPLSTSNISIHRYNQPVKRSIISMFILVH